MWQVCMLLAVVGVGREVVFGDAGRDGSAGFKIGGLASGDGVGVD